MSTATNEHVAWKLFEGVWSEKRRDRIDDFCATEFVCHGYGAPDGDLGWYKAWVESVVDGPSALTFTLDELVEEEDLVTLRWTATNERIVANFGPRYGDFAHPQAVSGVTVYRFEDGQAVESWADIDTVEMLRLVGVLSYEERSTT